MKVHVCVAKIFENGVLVNKILVEAFSDLSNALQWKDKYQTKLDKMYTNRSGKDQRAYASIETLDVK